MSDELGSREQRLQQVIAKYVQDVEAGKVPDPAQLIAQHPDLADDFRSFVAENEKMRGLVAHHQAATLGLDESAAAVGMKVRYFGDYELLEEMARGGMGVVFKARQVSLNRSVALKMILKGELASAADVERFRREAESAANLDHPNIVPIYEVGEYEGQHYFSMKLIERGASRDRNVSEEPHRVLAHATRTDAASLLAKVARAVHHAHQRGILHRDLKPGNILIDANGEPHVTDFGLAKRVASGGRESPDQSQTRTGVIVGTPAYMAPEQAQAAKGLTTAADVYSLGAVLYERLIGRPPFQGDDPLAILQKVVSQEPDRLRKVDPDIDADLETICLKCLEKDPARRYGSAEALADDLERWLRGEPIAARPVGTAERAWRWCRRNPVVASLIASLAVLLLAFTLGATLTALRLDASAKTERATANRERLARKDADEARSREAKERKQAELARDAATLALQRAESLRLAVQSNNVRAADPALALSLAIAGAERAQPRQADHNNAMLAALQECRELATFSEAVLKPLDRHKSHISFTNVALSPDGKLLATISDRHDWDGRPATHDRPELWKHRAVQIRDAQTGEVRATMQVKGMTFRSAHFSPDGKTLATLSEGAVFMWRGKQQIVLTDWCVRLWDVATGQEKHVLKGHRNRVVALDFSPDSRLLATGSWDHSVRIWDVASGKQLQVLQPEKDRILGGLAVALVSFSPDGSKLLTLTDGVNTHLDESGERWAAEVFLRSDPPAAALADITSFHSGPLGQGFHGPYRGADEDGTPAQLWDAATGKLIATLRPPDKKQRLEETTWTGFAPDGKEILTGHWQGSLNRWKADDGAHLGRWEGPATAVEWVYFSADAKRMIVQHASVWNRPPAGRWHDEESHNKVMVVTRDTASGAELSRWAADDRLGMLRVNRAGDGLLTMTQTAEAADAWRRAVQVRRADTGEIITDLRGHQDAISNAEFTPDGASIVTSGDDGTVRLWQADATPAWGLLLREHADPVNGAVFRPDGKQLLTFAGTPEPRHQLGDPLPGERRALLWDAASGRRVAELKGMSEPAAAAWRSFLLGDVQHAEYSPDGKSIVTVSNDWLPDDVPVELKDKLHFNPVRIWDSQTGKERFALQGLKSQIKEASFSPDGRYLLTRGDVSLASIDLRLEEKGILKSTGYSYGSHHADAAMQIWDAVTGKLVRVLRDSKHWCHGAAWSPNNKHVVLSAWAQGGITPVGYPLLAIWEVETGKVHVQLNTQAGNSSKLQFSPDGRLVLGLAGTTVLLWDAATGKQLRTLVGHTGDLTAAAFSPDSRLIATVGNDRLVRLWEAATGKEVRRLAGHTRKILRVTFSRDGRWLATAGEDGAARLWETASGQEWLTLTGHRGPVHSIAFRHDGQAVVTAGADQTVRVYPVDPLPAARERRPRALTAEERTRFQAPEEQP